MATICHQYHGCESNKESPPQFTYSCDGSSEQLPFATTNIDLNQQTKSQQYHLSCQDCIGGVIRGKGEDGGVVQTEGALQVWMKLKTWVGEAEECVGGEKGGGS